MTSENEPYPGHPADGNPAPNQASAGGGGASGSEPSMSEILQAMRGQQEATAKGFADLTSGLTQFLEKMAAVAGNAGSPPGAAGPPAGVPHPAAPAGTPPAQPVQPPPVDPAAYGHTIPAAGFPQASPQAVPQSGFPAPGQPYAVPQSGFPAMQNPQAPAPQTPATPVAQAVPAGNPAPQATSGFPDLRQPIRAARDMLRGNRPAPVQVAPPQAQPVPQQTAVDDRWQRILFGSDIANNQALQVLRDRVTEGLLAGDRNSTGLAGTILIFNSATSERMPQILKDVGEAYYRWNPRSAQGEDPLRNALIAWLHRKCEAAGVPNTIVVVRPGDRFEAARHNAKQQGVEVTEVGGWVVLRDNGKVYTKANVAVK